MIISCIAAITSTLLLDAMGNSLLHLATSRAKSDIVQEIFDTRIEINARNRLQETPLNLAVTSRDPGALGTVKVLLASGANAKCADCEGG
jgi:ankyrin repeat protein